MIVDDWLFMINDCKWWNDYLVNNGYVNIMIVNSYWYVDNMCIHTYIYIYICVCVCDMIMIVNGEWEQNLCVFPYDGGK